MTKCKRVKFNNPNCLVLGAGLLITLVKTETMCARDCLFGLCTLLMLYREIKIRGK